MKNKTLVFGGTGLIGSYILNNLSPGLVVGTTSRQVCPESRLRHFDILNSCQESFLESIFDMPGKHSVTHAVLSMMPLSVDQCFKDEELSLELNVYRMLSLCKKLSERNIIPIVLSSDYVYEGNKGGYTESDEENPTTVYGKHKLEFENRLLNFSNRVLILRLGKVISTENNPHSFLFNWARGMLSGQKEKLASDQIFGPVHLGDVLNVIIDFSDNDILGIFNVANGEQISRYDMYKKLHEKMMGYFPQTKDFSQRINLDQIKFEQKRPKNTSMLGTKLETQLRQKLKSSDWMFTKLASNLVIKDEKK